MLKYYYHCSDTQSCVFTFYFMKKANRWSCYFVLTEIFGISQEVAKKYRVEKCLSILPLNGSCKMPKSKKKNKAIQKMLTSSIQAPFTKQLISLLEKEMATDSSSLARRLRRREEAGGPLSMGITKSQTQLSNNFTVLLVFNFLYPHLQILPDQVRN